MGMEERLRGMKNTVPSNAVSEWVHPELEDPWAWLDTVLEINTGLPEPRWRVNFLTKRVELEFAITGGDNLSHLLLWAMPEFARPRFIQSLQVGATDFEHTGVAGLSVHPSGEVKFEQAYYLVAEDGVVLPEDGSFFIIASASYPID